MGRTEYQDELLIIAALVLFAREFEGAEPATAARSWELAQRRAAKHGIAPEEAVLRFDINPEEHD